MAKLKLTDRVQLQLAPSVLAIAPLAFMPESPRWLIYQERFEEARAVIIKYHAGGDENAPIVALEFDEICRALAFEKETQKMGFRALVATRPNRWRFAVVCATASECFLP